MIIGASSDVLADQIQFTEKESLNFPLMADPEQKLINACGVSRGQYANRVTFVVDQSGKIAKIYPQVNPATHPQEVYQFIKENLTETN